MRTGLRGWGNSFTLPLVCWSLEIREYFVDFKANSRNIALWVIVVLLIVTIFNIFHGNFRSEVKTLPLSEFIQRMDDKKVKTVVIQGNVIHGALDSGENFLTHIPHQYHTLIPDLREKVEKFDSKEPDPQPVSLLMVFLGLLPVLLLIGAWFFFFRQAQSSSGRAMGFGRSRARRSDPQKNRITFADVNGIDEAKQDLQEIVDFLKNPDRFRKIGGIIPKGVLLVGPPGTGKTLLARAVAGEAKAPFFSISGSDFVEMFVGVGASRVRDLFEQAKQNAPCIVFIDEIDAVGRHRGIGLGGGNDEREQTLNQLLVEMDGFDEKEEVIVIAATNRADVLDPALLRPGRFDRRVHIGLPDIRGREAILRGHMKRVRLAEDVDAMVIARGTPGFSGADLANLVNEAALLAASRLRKTVSMKEFEESKDKIIMGPERKSMVITDREKAITAYHEAGHAVVAFHLRGKADPIHKVTIIPRGNALGMVVRIPQVDHVSFSREHLMADIAIAMGGRIAEEKRYGPEAVTTGASCDFSTATEIARRMVTEWGMSSLVGPVSYAQRGRYDGGLELSDEVAKQIDHEVRKIVEDAYGTAEKIIKQNPGHLELVARYLIENETLTGEEVTELLTEGSIEKNVEKNSKEQNDAKKGASSKKKTSTSRKTKARALVSKEDALPQEG